MAQPASLRLVGAILSRRWRLSNKLGDGGMGEVYAADSLDGGSRVAIKLLRPEFLSQSQILARFLDEARTCMRLIHPNIVRVIACAAAEDGSPYIVMELLEGVPLGAYTRNGGRVPLAQAVPILQGILAGLAAAHAQSVVHRDLKPDNVFLARDPGRTYVVKVLDFGIAKVMDLAGGMGSRTSTGMFLGTPAYMSPEQIRSARDVDQRADLWSAGVMFYEMLTGRTAFPAPTEYARLAAVLTSEPQPMERIDPALSPVAAFVARALKKNRDERFGSALEMARALVAAAPHAAARDERSGAIAAMGAFPLSELPEVPSACSFSAVVWPSSTRPVEHASTAPLLAASVQAGVPRGPDSTLASARSDRAVAGPAAPILVVDPSSLGETLPSNDLPAAKPTHKRRLPVFVLVTLALVAGFLLGWALSRLGNAVAGFPFSERGGSRGDGERGDVRSEPVPEVGRRAVESCDKGG